MERPRRDFETFFSKAPKLHPNAALITGVVCGVRVEDDKLVDERARGKAMESILRALAGGGPVTRAAPVTE